jgi:hypothetical protein
MSEELQIPVDIDSLSQDEILAIAKAELLRRARVSAAHKGVPKSQETRQKMSKSRKGSRHTPETRQRMSEAKRESWARKKAAEARELTERNELIARLESVTRELETLQRGGN